LHQVRPVKPVHKTLFLSSDIEKEEKKQRKEKREALLVPQLTGVSQSVPVSERDRLREEGL